MPFFLPAHISACKPVHPPPFGTRGLVALSVIGALLFAPVAADAAPHKPAPAAKSTAARVTVKSAPNKDKSAKAKPEAVRTSNKPVQTKAAARKAATGKSIAASNATPAKPAQLSTRQSSRQAKLSRHELAKSGGKAASRGSSKAAPSVSYSLRQPSPMHGFAAQQNLRPKLRVESEEPPVPHLSYGELAGLRSTPDALDLKSSVALVVDQDTNQVLLRKNDSAVLPIASLTKLMTGLIISEARLPLDEQLTIEQEDVDTEKHSRSRLRVGTTMSRGELLHLALMSSENRAAHALGRTYPGGISRFVSQMNARAMMLGMRDTRYVEPTGLSSANQSSAVDLATLVGVAYNNAQVRELSTSPSYELEVGNRLMLFNNTNRLVNNPEWEIGLQKTGYISEAGQCLVMQARIAGRKLIMVFLDSAGKMSRIGDAERVRRWIENTHPAFPSLRTTGVPSISG